MRKALAISFLLACAGAASMLAVGEARLTGKVVDHNGNPIPDVNITVTSATPAKTFNLKTKTDKGGKIAIFLLDGTIPYKFVYSKEGFQSLEESFKLRLLPEKNDREIRLIPVAVAAAAAPQAAQPVADPAVAAYNDGAALANEGKDKEAIAKIEEAVALKPDLTAAHIALAKLYARTGEWPRAVNAAVTALEVDAENPDMMTLLAEGYERTGEKAKAAEFRKRAPANPATLFNEAARMINASKDSEAEPLLKKAIAADESFAPAHYELGMIYARGGKNADAKTHLEKYLELEPKGKDAPTAKEMLNYIK